MDLEDNEAGGQSVILHPGDALDRVPASHRSLITPAMRQVFADPRAYFRAAADRCRFPKMAEWLRAVTEPNRWTLDLHHGYGGYSSAGFHWRSEVVRSATIALPAEASPQDGQYPADVRHYFSLVGTVDFMGFGCPGQLYDGCNLNTLRTFTSNPRIPADLDTSYIWGCSPSGSHLFFTQNGRAGWLMIGGDRMYFTGDIPQTIKLVYSYFLAGKGPDPYEKPVRAEHEKKVARRGYIDRDGSLAVPLQYDLVSRFREGLAGVTKDGLEGCIDRAGRVVIPLKFQALGNFWNGLASAKLDGKYGYIDKTGQFAVPPQFDSAYGFHSTYAWGHADLAKVQVDDKWGYINRTGQYVVPPTYKVAEEFADGFALVDDSSDGKEKWFIDLQGKKRFGPFGSAEPFSDGLALVTDAQGRRFIDTNGKTILILPAKVYAKMFREGLAAAQDSTRFQHPGDDITEGYIDRKCRWAIEPRFDSAFWFCNGFAQVEIAGLYGLIDKKGNYLVPPEFEKLGNLQDQRISFYRNWRYGFLDAQGRVVIEPVYDYVGDFSEGLAAVCIYE